MDASLTLAFAAFVGALVGSAATIYVNARIADQERKENRRKQRLDYLLNAIRVLVGLYAAYEEFIQKDEGAFGSPIQRSSIHAKIIGQAIAEILSLDDPDLKQIAVDRLTPNMVTAHENEEEAKKWGEYRTRNRNALQEILEKLGRLVSQT